MDWNRIEYWGGLCGLGENRNRACIGWDRIEMSMHGVEYNRGRVCMGWDKIGGRHAWGGWTE